MDRGNAESMSDSKKATFLATVAPILTGIKVDGTGGGMRVQFDIPESEMSHAAYLLMMRQVVLNITVEPYDGFSNIHEDKKS